MRKIKRAIHIDFHTMPGITDFGQNYTGDEIAQILDDANVDYVNVFARCNIGYSYYPTKIGEMYPGVHADLLGDTIKSCHKHGIGVTAYLNGGLNHRLLVEKPGYMKIDKYGRCYGEEKVEDNFFRSPCFNTGYRQYLLSEIKEILEKEPDGIFCDCLSPKSCYCPACIDKMQKAGIDINDDDKVLDFAVNTMKSVFAEIRAIVPENVRLYLNSYPYEDIAEYESHAELECLPTDLWGYDYFTAQAPYYRKFADEKVYMTGRFVKGWGDFGGNKPVASIENDIYDALLYGYVPSVGDHMHPSNGLDKKLYANIGKAYKFVESLEKWTDNTRPLTEVAVLRNKLTSKNILAPLTESDKGAARMLAELKICFDVVNEDMDFDDYKVLVLPDNIEITDKLCEKLEKFRGGIISSGSSIKSGSIWDYISEFTTDSNQDGFYALDNECFGQYCCGIKMKSEYSIADYIEPYFKRQFDGKHGYFYNPPSKCIGFSAVALKENKVHICFNIFEAYMKIGPSFHKDLIKSLLDILLPEKLIVADGLPSTARATLMDGENNILHIKTTYPELRGDRGIIEEHVMLPEGAKVSVLGEYKEVYALPEMKKTNCMYKDGRTEIILPEICGYRAFLLKK